MGNLAVTTPITRLPLFSKLLLTAFVAVLVPKYWLDYGLTIYPEEVRSLWETRSQNGRNDMRTNSIAARPKNPGSDNLDDHPRRLAGRVQAYHGGQV